MHSFRKKLEAANKLAPSPKLSKKLDQADFMDKEVNQAFAGSPSEQAEKQKRLSKSNHYHGNASSRSAK